MQIRVGFLVTFGAVSFVKPLTFNLGVALLLPLCTRDQHERSKETNKNQ